jgi:HK97 family phage prohead protease
MSKREIRTIPAKELRISQVAADGTRTITGTAIVFNSRSLDLGGFQEIVSPGAVTKTLSSGSNVLLLNNHQTSQPLGSTRSGSLNITTDSKGVNFSCKIDTRQSYASDLAYSIENNVTQGCSFGFYTEEDTWSNDNGILTRTLESISIFELSLTVAPAYESTTATVRTSIQTCPKELRSLLHRSSSEQDNDDCDCERDEEGNLIDPDCTCDDEDDDEDRSKRSVLVSESERSRTMLKIEIAKRK